MSIRIRHPEPPQKRKSSGGPGSRPGLRRVTNFGIFTKRCDSHSGGFDDDVVAAGDDLSRW